jgi:hypothetical protein
MRTLQGGVRVGSRRDHREAQNEAPISRRESPAEHGSKSRIQITPRVRGEKKCSIACAGWSKQYRTKSFSKEVRLQSRTSLFRLNSRSLRQSLRFIVNDLVRRRSRGHGGGLA